MNYRLFIAVDVMDFLETQNRPRRKEVLAHFRRLQDAPEFHSDYFEADEDGRPVNVSIFRGLAVYYWLDHADRQVRILKMVEAG